MSHSAGFLSNAASVAGITTSYDLTKKLTLLGVPSAPASPPSPAVTIVDGAARKMPQSCWLSHLEVQLTDGGTGATKLFYKLYWDSAGDHHFLGEGTIDLFATMTTAQTKGGVSAIDAWVTSPTIQTTAGTLYMVCKTDAGTVTVARVRLNWADRR